MLPIFRSLKNTVTALLGQSSPAGTAGAERIVLSRNPGSDPMTTEANPAPATDQAPVTVVHTWTDEANAIKLQVSRMILPMGEKRAYPDPESSGESPLAQALFEIDGVKGVELDAVSVKVFMAEDGDWDAISERVPEVIKGHLDMGLSAVEGLDPAGSKKYDFGFRQVEQARPREEQLKIVQDLLDNEINPAVSAHGGFFSLVDIEDNTVYVTLGGGCQGCGMVDVTLRQGVEQRMKEVLPEMVALVDTTDHASGDNPYYTPGK